MWAGTSEQARTRRHTNSSARGKAYFDAEIPRLVQGKAALEVREVLKLLQLVLPRRFLILLNLHLPALLVHALQRLNHLVRISWWSWAQSSASGIARSILQTSR